MSGNNGSRGIQSCDGGIIITPAHRVGSHHRGATLPSSGQALKVAATRADSGAGDGIEYFWPEMQEKFRTDPLPAQGHGASFTSGLPAPACGKQGTKFREPQRPGKIPGIKEKY